MQQRHSDALAAEVAGLEEAIRHHLVDLEVAFQTRDWALVARIYRSVAGIADRLEETDPAARTRELERLEREQETARISSPDPDELEAWDDADDLGELVEWELPASPDGAPPSDAPPGGDALA